MIDAAIANRFWSKVERRGPGECWPWTGPLYEGYGSFGMGGRSYKAHRACLVIMGRDVPPKMPADHICRNRACVNPSHIRIVDPKTNTLENSVAVTAINASKTHCHRGHEFTPENTRMKGVSRNCRKCRGINKRLLRQRRKADAQG